MKLQIPSLLLGATALAAAAITAACGSGDSGPSLEVHDVSGRTTLGDVAAVFVTIANDGETDYLVSASAVGGAAGRVGEVQLHETVTEGSTSRMQQVERLEIPAKGELALRPGGYHIMLIKVDPPFEPGDTVTVELVFEIHGPIAVTATLAAPAEGGMQGGSSMSGNHGGQQPR